MAKQLRELKGVGEKTEKLFQKIGITTTDDLLHYYPRNYDAYEEPEEIGSLKENTVAAIRATITTGVYVNKIRNLQVISITVADTTGRLAVAWFNAPYLKNTLKKGSCFILRGKVSRKKGRLEMEHPEIFTPGCLRGSSAQHAANLRPYGRINQQADHQADAPDSGRAEPADRISPG